MSKSDEIVPPRAEIRKLPRVTCLHCGITQAKPAMDGDRCRNREACERRFNREVRRREGTQR